MEKNEKDSGTGYENGHSLCLQRASSFVLASPPQMQIEVTNKSWFELSIPFSFNKLAALQSGVNQ